MTTMEKKTKKRNFPVTEIEVLVSEAEERKNILFGGHSSRVTNKRKDSKWHHVVAAVNAVGATQRTVPEIKGNGLSPFIVSLLSHNLRKPDVPTAHINNAIQDGWHYCTPGWLRYPRPKKII